MSGETYRRELLHWDLIRTTVNLGLGVILAVLGPVWSHIYNATGYWFYPDYAWFGTWLDYLMGPDPTGHHEVIWWTVPFGFVTILIFDWWMMKGKKIAKVGRGITIASLWLLYALMWFISFIYYLADPSGQGPAKAIADPYDWFVWSNQLNAPWLFYFGIGGCIFMGIPILVTTYLFIRAAELETNKGITKIVQNIARLLKMLWLGR